MFTIKDRKKTKEKKVPDQRSEENKRKRKFSIKDRKKTKEDIQKGLWTRQYLNNTKLSQANKKGNHGLK